MTWEEKPSFRRERRRRVRELRRRGVTTKQIARTFARDYNESLLKAFRWAHDWALAEACERFNDDVADDPEHEAMSARRLSLYENWPRSANPECRPPGVPLLQAFARLYQCAPADLVEGTDYTLESEHHAEASAVDAPPSQDAAAVGEAGAARSTLYLFGDPIQQLLSPAAQASEPTPTNAPAASEEDRTFEADTGPLPDSALAEAVLAARKQAGRELARLRHAAGLSQQDLAHRVGYARAHVAGAETATNSTAAEFWRACDQLLGARGALLAARDRVEAAQKARRDAALRRDQADREARLQQWRQEQGILGVQPHSLKWTSKRRVLHCRRRLSARPCWSRLV